MTVRTGSVAGVMGPNGAGKTTLINLISGLLPSDSGTIRFAGAEIQRAPALRHRRAGHRAHLSERAAVQRHDGAGAGDGGLLRAARRERCGPRSSACRRHARHAQAAERHASELLDRVALSHLAHVLAETLSYGEQRRVEIARALGTSPRLLLLDEPTAGMNVQESNEIGSLVHGLRDGGLTVLMVEHNVRLVKEFCDHVTVMNFGRLLATGTPAECIAHPDVQAAYFGNTADAERIRALR